MRTMWTIFHATAVSLMLVMCGNVGALLFVVLDSTYFVGRNVSTKIEDFISECPDDAKKEKKCKTG